MNIQQLPKLELHCHLDGSLVKTMMERYLGRPVSESELTVSENCRSLTEYLEKFDLPLQCLQDERDWKKALMPLWKIFPKKMCSISK